MSTVPDYTLHTITFTGTNFILNPFTAYCKLGEIYGEIDSYTATSAVCTFSGGIPHTPSGGL